MNVLSSDHLSVLGKINIYDYEYLSGKWEGLRGAAFNVVAEWCKNHQFGSYGQPSERGLKAMEEFEFRVMFPE